MKERELERMESLGADDSDMSDNRMDHLREAVKNFLRNYNNWKIASVRTPSHRWTI